jgi:hypothetical protein
MESYLYKRAHHRAISSILQAFDGELLRSADCMFGGGTAMALEFGEYRESLDIDLMVSSREGYRSVRTLVKDKGVQALFKTQVKVLREPLMDTYAIRSAVESDGEKIKFEIVHEGRIELEPAASAPQVLGVPTLCLVDMVAEKLLANSDRWADRSYKSRDLIDLAMIPDGKIPIESVIKVIKAYGDSAMRDFEKAKTRLLSEQDYLRECMAAMAMDMPQAKLWSKIQRLKWPDMTVR